MGSQKTLIPNTPCHSGKAFFALFNIGFWILVVAGILMLYHQGDPYQRPPGFLITIILMAGVLVCEVFYSTEQTSRLILPQIILLGVSITWSQVINYPSIVGVDPWFHQMFTNHLIEYHHLTQDYSYAHFPIFHLIVGQTAILTGLDYKTATLFSANLIQISCNVLFVYLLTVTVLRNPKVGILASLLVVISPYHIYMSNSPIPNAFAAVFIVIGLYLLFRRREVSGFFIGLLGLILGTLALTHTISALCMAILLFTAWGASVVYRRWHPGYERYSFSLPLAVIFTAAMLGWWLMDTITGRTLAELLMESFDVHFFNTGPADLLDYTPWLPVEVAYNNTGIYLPLFFSLIGILFMISVRATPRQFVAAFVGLAPFIVTFLALFAGIAIIPDRWFYFSGIFLSVPLALAIFLVAENWKDRSPIISVAIPVLDCYLLRIPGHHKPGGRGGRPLGSIRLPQ